METAHGLAPEDDQITLWTAMMLAGAGRIPEARHLLAEALAVEPRGVEHLRRFLAAGGLPHQVGEAIEALASEARPT